MNMDPLVYLCAAAAVALPVLRWIPLFLYSIHEEAFTVQIVKLLQAGNYTRAQKLCSAATRAFYVAMVKATLEAGKACKPDDGERLVEETLRDGFQREYSVQMKRARSLGFLPPLGALAAALGLFIAGKDPAEPGVVYAPPLVAIVLWVASLRKVQRLRSRSLNGLERILPAAVRHITSREGSAA